MVALIVAVVGWFLWMLSDAIPSTDLAGRAVNALATLPLAWASVLSPDPLVPPGC